MSAPLERAMARSQDGDRIATLRLQYNGTILQVGEVVSADVASSPPTLHFKPHDPGAAYLAIAFDLDAPFPSFPVLSPLLHWIQPGLKATDAEVLVAQAKCMVDWLNPTPPPLSGPHRYVFALYKEANGFDATKARELLPSSMSVWNRTKFDLGGFCTKAGLGDIVATACFKA